nr:MAG TPA: hypothetical protein [Caudoviricetes sp.]
MLEQKYNNLHRNICQNGRCFSLLRSRNAPFFVPNFRRR